MLNYSGSIPLNKPPVDLLKMARWFKVFSEPKRLLIIDLLMQGVQCNCELGDALQMAPNLISHHLSILRKAGLVEVERDPVDSRWIYYSINQNALEDLNLAFGDFFDPPGSSPAAPPAARAVLLSALKTSRYPKDNLSFLQTPFFTNNTSKEIEII
jgi:ArsR family transcriptional regulator, arsenate/arsenite/antimonite-responsive transcriptional repressor